MRHVFLNLGHFQTHFFLLLYPTIVLTLERETGAGYGDLLLPSTAGFVAFAALTLPAAWAGDRWPRRGLIALLFFGLAAGSLLAAASNGPLLLAGGLALIGAAAAIYHPVGIAELVDRAENTGQAIGVNGVWGNLGVAAAPITAAGLADGVGWRWAFLVPAVFALATGLIYLARDRVPRGSHAKPAEQSRATRVALARVAGFLFCSALCGGLLFNAVTVVLPKLIAVQLHSGAALRAGAIASVIFALAAFSQLASGRLLDRVPARLLAGSLTTLQGVALVLLALSDGWVAIGFALFLVTTLFAELPVSDTLVKRVTTPEVRARAYGLLYVLTFGSSVVTVPLVSALYRDGDGFDLLLWLLAGAAALLAASAWALPRGAADPQLRAAAA